MAEFPREGNLGCSEPVKDSKGPTMRGLSLTEIVLYKDADMSILPNTGSSTEKNTNKQQHDDSRPLLTLTTRYDSSLGWEEQRIGGQMRLPHIPVHVS